MTGPRTFTILKGFSLIKSNMLLGLVVRINIIFIFSVFYRRYTLFFFFRVSSLTLFLLANFFIILLKKIKSCRSSSYNLWISSTYTKAYDTNSLHILIFSETSASNPLFIKNRILLVILCSEILYASILIGNNLI